MTQQVRDETAVPGPRAFAQGVGLVLQTVGVLLFLSSCLVCATARMWERPPTQSQVFDELQNDPTLADRTARNLLDDPVRTGVMLTIMFSTVGGLAMAGVGLGVQSERRRAAGGAVAVTVGLLLVMIIAGVGLWSGGAAGGGWGMRIWHAAICVLLLLMTGLSLGAWRQFRANPPPRDVDIVPAGTKIPYSWYHDDPPDVRMAGEIAARRARLAAEQAELDQLERELKNKSQPPEAKREPEGGRNDL